MWRWGDGKEEEWGMSHLSVLPLQLGVNLGMCCLQLLMGVIGPGSYVSPKNYK